MTSLRPVDKINYKKPVFPEGPEVERMEPPLPWEVARATLPFPVFPDRAGGRASGARDPLVMLTLVTLLLMTLTAFVTLTSVTMLS